MFEVGSNIFEEVASAAQPLPKATPTPVRALETSGIGRELMPQVMASRCMKRRAMVHLALGRSADKTRAVSKGRHRPRRRWADHRSQGGSANVVRPANETRRPYPRREGKNDAILCQEGKA
jgi:hypothetical protein